MKLYEIAAYQENDEEKKKMRINEAMNDLIDLAKGETERPSSCCGGSAEKWRHHEEKEQAKLIGVGFLLENLTATNQTENEYLINEVKEVINFIKNKRSFSNYKLTKRKMRKGIIDFDIRFDQRLDAEKIIQDEEFSLILKDYLKDKYLRDEVLKSVQEILNLIYEYRKKREKKKDRIHELKEELKEEYRLKNTELSEENFNNPYEL